MVVKIEHIATIANGSGRVFTVLQGRNAAGITA